MGLNGEINRARRRESRKTSPKKEPPEPEDSFKEECEEEDNMSITVNLSVGSQAQQVRMAIEEKMQEYIEKADKAEMNNEHKASEVYMDKVAELRRVKEQIEEQNEGTVEPENSDFIYSSYDIRDGEIVGGTVQDDVGVHDFTLKSNDRIVFDREKNDPPSESKIMSEIREIRGY